MRERAQANVCVGVGGLSLQESAKSLKSGERGLPEWLQGRCFFSLGCGGGALSDERAPGKAVVILLF